MISFCLYLAFLVLFLCWKESLSSGKVESFLSCYNGAYEVKLPPFNTCAGFRDCEEGSYCVNGIKAPCPAGFYGDRSRLNTSECSGLCPAGFYCPTGTVRSTSFPCGGSNVYCPLGSQEPIPVPVGYYSVDINGSESLLTLATRVAIEICPIGHYCADGVKYSCPPGTYGNRIGLSNVNCSGPCVEGFYCPERSVSPFEIDCGASPVVYCPPASGRPNRTALGYYALRTNISMTYASGFVYQEPCPLGSYCVDGVRYLCPAGRYGLKIRETNASCTGGCLGGYYCPPGSTLSNEIQCDGTNIYCPPGSGSPRNVTLGYYTVSLDQYTGPPFQDFYTRLVQLYGDNVFQGYAFTNQTICEPGFYCLADGIKRPCPRGRYGSTYGLSTSLCSGACEQGYYCPEGSSKAKQIPCGGVNVFCPRGSARPQYVNPGYYTIGSEDPKTRTSERLCEPGFYCQNGIKQLCLAGFYGSTFGLQVSNCTDVCLPGYYCPEGSISAKEVMCGDASRFCPGNSPRPINVTLGWYTTGGNESTRIGQAIAPKGYYALNGLLYPCPAGYYGSEEGLYSPQCSGMCFVDGFFCPVASISPIMRFCGSDNFFCPAGTVAPLNVQIGYYTSDYQYEGCPPGQWRNLTIPPIDFTQLPASSIATISPLPQCELCPQGTYKAVSGDDYSLCLKCNPRDSQSSANRQVCDCTRVYESGYVGYFNISTGQCEKLLISSIAALDASEWQRNISLTRYQQYPCEPGYYCQGGLRYLCPAGYYGTRSEETRWNCTGLCAEGYYCPLGSTSPFMIPCGAANVICPTGSPSPIYVPAGYYTNEDRREDLRYEQFICPVGYYCPGDGRRYQCPPGTYTSQEGTSSDQCMGPCSKGYYCLAGSSSPKQYACGNSTVYCPTGSFQPSPVHEGYYCSHTGVSAGADAFWDPDNTTCTVELPCEPGYFCTGGIKQPCPPGTFGWRYGLQTAKCDGLCAAGYYCPSYLSVQPGAPPITVWPQKPHTRPDDLPCSDVNYYCPRGSTYPTAVQRGYYSIGGNPDNKTRRGEVICPAGSYCDHAIARLCPPGRYGSTTGLADSSCTAGCPAGYYCPSGTINPISCPDQTYSTGLTWSCTSCPGVRTTTLKCQTDSTCCLRY